ncbi:MAG: hypothetical protein ACYCVB_03370 [Bacilli bacterium]
MVDLVREIAEEEFAKGEAKGETKKALAVARAMLAKGMDDALVSEVTGLSIEELERLHKEMSN